MRCVHTGLDMSPVQDSSMEVQDPAELQLSPEEA